MVFGNMPLQFLMQIPKEDPARSIGPSFISPLPLNPLLACTQQTASKTALAFFIKKTLCVKPALQKHIAL